MQIKYHPHAVACMLERKISTEEIESIVKDPDGKIRQTKDKAIYYKKLKARRDNLVVAVVLERFPDDAVEIITVLINFEVRK